MNTMSMPKFTAESSLYKSEGAYATLHTSIGGELIARVNPAASIGRQAVKGNGVGGGAACFGVCMAICWFVGESNCITRCAKICGGEVIVIVVF